MSEHIVSYHRPMCGRKLEIYSQHPALDIPEASAEYWRWCLEKQRTEAEKLAMLEELGKKYGG
jgi:hypothetical protein